MRPQYYADLYRRYSTFVKNYSGNTIFRIACGANTTDYNWTEVLMQRVGRRMNGLSLHYYTIPSGNWNRKGSATEFSEADWHATLRRSLFMDELIGRHAAIMDRYDEQRRVGLIVDEWGTWYDVEPGTNPGFLYQQNTLRDALVAGLHFNIFHEHADRVVMANIAQTVNVLQAMILTAADRIVLTPTYWVFEMYKVHQGATLLSATLTGDDYSWGGETIPQISASASQNPSGIVHVSLCNTDPNRPARLECRLEGLTPEAVTGRVMTAETMNAHNTFDDPDVVRPQRLTGIQLSGNLITLTLPPKSVAVLAAQ